MTNRNFGQNSQLALNSTKQWDQTCYNGYLNRFPHKVGVYTAPHDSSNVIFLIFLVLVGTIKKLILIYQ